MGVVRKSDLEKKKEPEPSLVPDVPPVPPAPVRRMASKFVREKALTLRPERLFGAVVWSVSSGLSVYLVVWCPLPRSMSCTCPAGQHNRGSVCSHMESVRRSFQDETGWDLMVDTGIQA